MSAKLHTCGRCGLTDDSVLDLDTGGAFHRELFHCITKLRQRYEPIAAAVQLYMLADEEYNNAILEGSADRLMTADAAREEARLDLIEVAHSLNKSTENKIPQILPWRRK